MLLFERSEQLADVHRPADGHDDGQRCEQPHAHDQHHFPQAHPEFDWHYASPERCCALSLRLISGLGNKMDPTNIVVMVAAMEINPTRAEGISNPDQVLHGAQAENGGQAGQQGEKRAG